MRIVIVTDFMDPASLGGSTRVVLEHGTGLARRGHKVAVISGSRNRSGTEMYDGVTFHWFRYEPTPSKTPQAVSIHGVPNSRPIRHEMNGIRSAAFPLLERFSPLLLPRKLFACIARKFAPEAVICHQPLSALSVLSGAGKRIPIKLYNFHSPWPEEFLLESWHAAGKALPGDVLASEEAAPQKEKERQKTTCVSPRSSDSGERDKNTSCHANAGSLRLSSSYVRTSAGYRLRRTLERRALEQCDGIIVLSKYMGRLLEEVHRYRNWNSRLVPGGVDTTKFAPVADIGYARARFSIPRHSFVVSTVRRLISRMGLSNLIEAVRQLRSEGRNILLLIGGRGPLAGELEALVKEAGLSTAVRFLGHVDEAEMRLLYGASDLVVVPTLALEGFGLVVVEALACGVVTLGTPVGGIPEILRPLDNRLVLGGTGADAIASGIRYWHEHVQEIEKLRPRCREYVCENFTWDRAVVALENVLESFSKESGRT